MLLRTTVSSLFTTVVGIVCVSPIISSLPYSSPWSKGRLSVPEGETKKAKVKVN